MTLRRTLIAFILLTASLKAPGQYYDSGQDPASLKWLKINTGRFLVIYPENYGQAGRQFATDLENANAALSEIFPSRKYRIPVIIHNHTTQSNGFVAWAPKRMEVYPTPEQNSIPLDPNRQLALHELTHVLQMETLNSGFSKTMSFLFGQQFPGATAALLPPWYMEGDAVFAESALTGAGRGNIPAFQKELKALSLNKKPFYSYDKMINGSYRDYVPDHYQLGYQMVAWSYYANNTKVWNDVVNYTGRNPFLINPVNINLKKNTGLTKKLLFSQAFDSLRYLWSRDNESQEIRSYVPLNPAKGKEYINYYSPLIAGRDSVFALKTSMYAPMSVVLINPSSGSEKKILVPGSVYPRSFSYGAGRLVWVETRTDPRWDNRNYSVVRLYDIKLKSSRQVSFRSRYMAASISGDGRLVAVSENTIDNRNLLTFLDSYTGNVLKSVPSPGNSIIQYPRWSNNNNIISMIFLDQEGEGVRTFNHITGEWKTLIDSDKNDIQSAYVRNDTLFYVSSVSGTDNAYFIPPGGNSFKVTSSAFGAYDALPASGELYFSDYTAGGFNISKVSLGDALPYNGERFSDGIIAERSGINPVIMAGPDTTKYNPEPYRKWQHLFGLHSWMPFYADIEEVQADPLSVRPGLTVLSQNHLSTLISSAGYEYSEAGEHVFHTRLTWKGWYPVIDTRLDYGNFTNIDLAGENVAAPPVKPGLGLKSRIYLPLGFSTGRFNQVIYPSFTGDFKRRYVYLKDEKRFDEGQTQLTARLYFSNSHRSAKRDIFPRWAQVADISKTWSPFDESIYGSDFAFRGALYFPGIFRNNGVRLRYETEKQSFARYLTSNTIRYPRGYRNIVSEKLTFLSADYAFPVLYPDLNIGPLIYIPRIRASLFFDHAKGTNNYYLKTTSAGLSVDRRVDGTEFFTSAGIELLGDFHLFRVPYPVTAGIQSTWVKDETIPSVRLIFNIDIYGMIIGD